MTGKMIEKLNELRAAYLTGFWRGGHQRAGSEARVPVDDSSSEMDCAAASYSIMNPR
jgi:hypothetical protein